MGAMASQITSLTIVYSTAYYPHEPLFDSYEYDLVYGRYLACHNNSLNELVSHALWKNMTLGPL